MKSHRTRRLVEQALKNYGPLSDHRLAGYLAFFDLTPAAARAMRNQLVREGLVQRTSRIETKTAGPVRQTWAVVPGVADHHTGITF